MNAIVPRRARRFLDAQNDASGLRSNLRIFLDERGYQYAEDFFIYPLQTVNSLAPGATQVLPINIEADSAFEWILATGNCDVAESTPFSNVPAIEVQVIDSVSARNLMNGPIPFGNLFGTGQQPFFLPIPRRFMSSTQVQVAFHNYSTGTTYTRITIALIGRKIYKTALPGVNSPPLARFVTWRDDATGQLFSEDLYMYDFAAPDTLHDGDSIPINVIMEADSDFEWIVTNYAEGITNGETVGPAASAVFAQVREGGTGRDLFVDPLPVALMAGTATFPAIVQQPKVFSAKMNVKVTLTNHSGGDLDNLRFTMLGRKIFQLDG